MENKYHDVYQENQDKKWTNVGQIFTVCHYVFGLGVGTLVGELAKTRVFEKRIMRTAYFRLNMG